MVDHPSAILSDKIAVGYVSGPEFLTAVSTVSGGYERRNARRAKARWRFDFSGAELNADEVRELLDFYMGRLGPLYSWLLKDWWNYQLIDETALIGGTVLVAAGGETTAQIIKRYSVGNNPYAARSSTSPRARSRSLSMACSTAAQAMSTVW